MTLRIRRGVAGVVVIVVRVRREGLALVALEAAEELLGQRRREVLREVAPLLLVRGEVVDAERAASPGAALVFLWWHKLCSSL